MSTTENNGDKGMDYPRFSVGSLALLSLVIIGILFISISTTDISRSFLSLKYYQCSPSNETTTRVSTEDELGEALSRASMADKTVIIAILNKAYTEGDKPMLDLFLDSFWLGNDTQSLIDHLLLVAMDQTAYDRCMFLRLHCYKLLTDGVDFGGEKLYMSSDFINMMWRRTLFLVDVLERGYNLIFTDTDIMWLGNPFTWLSKNESVDIQISVDHFKGDPWSRSNPINTGFYYVLSNNKTTTLFQTWYANRNNTDYAQMKEQDVLGKMIEKGVLEELGLKVKFLDTLHFSGFCENSRDFRAVATVHANCCRSINAKVADLLVVLRDWKRFKASIDLPKNSSSISANQTDTVGWSNHIACANSWKK